MVYFMENPNLKWMMTGGTPMTQENASVDSVAQNKFVVGVKRMVFLAD